MTELTIKLKATEREALRRAAREKRLHPRDLAQLYIRQALLAGSNATPITTQQPEPVAVAQS